jgi:hypothetical protein
MPLTEHERRRSTANGINQKEFPTLEQKPLSSKNTERTIATAASSSKAVIIN